MALRDELIGSGRAPLQHQLTELRIFLENIARKHLGRMTDCRPRMYNVSSGETNALSD